ncbi:hypothetical protein ACQEVB_30210 [Pseudonocardia sp. CA-107938]|uniref:hypothetical protein n=1 Tax=Pseudonocardia sp. CA-107938 TaxID=3240021 RepID=UPI003D9422A1
MPASSGTRRWVLGLDAEVADRGSSPATSRSARRPPPEGAVLTEPEQIGRRHWDLHVRREPVDQLVTG